jgi:hypothetical protein
LVVLGYWHTGIAMPQQTTSVLLPLALGIGGVLLAGVVLALPRLRRSRLPAVLLVLLPPVPAALWWYHLPPPIQTDKAPGADQGIWLRGIESVNVVTDLGRRIPVAVLATSLPDSLLADIEQEYLLTSSLKKKVIERTDPDSTHNCYGWVFTGGRYWVPFDMVDGILADNQYEQVSNPSQGDLALYRGAEGQVVHSGIVLHADDCTLIESKWGPLGRYIHRPDDQPFGGTCMFYHSPRRGHLLAGLPTDENHALSQDPNR